jgi:hypothetical protein
MFAASVLLMLTRTLSHGFTVERHAPGAAGVTIAGSGVATRVRLVSSNTGSSMAVPTLSPL